MLTIRRPEKFDWANIPLKECIEGNAMDSHFTLLLFNKFYDILEQEDRLSLVQEVLSPSIEHLAYVEYNGLDVDLDSLNKLDVELTEEMNSIEESIDSLNLYLESTDGAISNINIKSSKDLADVLYFQEGMFELFPVKFSSKTTAPSTDRESLELTLEAVEKKLLLRKDDDAE